MIILILMFGCVSPNVAINFAKRAHPECQKFEVYRHSYKSGGDYPGSQTEISLTCDGAPRAMSVKCIHGFGIISQTTCHQNN